MADEQGQETLIDLVDKYVLKAAAKNTHKFWNELLCAASTNNLKSITKEKLKNYLGAQQLTQMAAPKKRMVQI